MFDRNNLLNNIAFISVNSKAGEYGLNKQTILAGLEQANKKRGINVISALPLNGPSAQGYYSYFNTDAYEEEMFEMLNELLQDERVQTADPESVTMLSFPWFHRDPSKPASHPFYKSQNGSMDRPFYATALIKGGKLEGINLHAHLGYPEGGPYDARVFAQWGHERPAENVQVMGKELLVGNLHVHIESDIYLLAASVDEAKIRLQSSAESNEEIDGVIINGSAGYVQEEVAMLSMSPEFKDLAVIVNNPLGSDSGDKAYDGASYIYCNGEAIYATPDSEKYTFESAYVKVTDEKVVVDNDRKSTIMRENQIRASALWLRDYLLSSAQQGLVISMSEGMKSAYTLLVASKMIDDSIKAAGGLANLFDPKVHNNFAHLKCKGDVLKKLESDGEQIAIRFLKSKMLDCPYSPNNRPNEAENQALMKQLVDNIGASFYVTDAKPIIDSNLSAMEQALKDKGREADFEAFKMKMNEKSDIDRAAYERAATMVGGIFGNMGNKIAMSTASATDVAMGKLHAGGAGQEGPISVTLSHSDRQIRRNLKYLVNAEQRVIVDKIAPADEIVEDLELLSDAIMYKLLIEKQSPYQVYQTLMQDEAGWNSNPQGLMRCIDYVCEAWSKNQPSRVALAISPNIGPYGLSLDRYRSVRNSRDNEYFNNGRVELRLEWMYMRSPNNLMAALSDAKTKALILSEDWLSKKKEIQDAISAYQTQNNVRPKTNVNQTNPNPTPSLNIGTASLHQRMFDYANNKKNIKTAIDQAVAAGQDVLLMPELTLTGYFGDGDFDWINNPEEGYKILSHLMDIAEYSKETELVISIGLPLFISPYTKPFNGQAILHRGKVIAISLKTNQPDGSIEFEARNFTSYDLTKFSPVNKIKIPNQTEPVLIGKPVVIIKDKNGNEVPLVHEQCAEAWTAIGPEGKTDHALQEEKRYLTQVVEKYPGLVVLNPSGSKGQVYHDKTNLRGQLAVAIQHLDIAGYVYANVNGDDNGTVVADGDAFIMGKPDSSGNFVIHHGRRYSMRDVSTQSMAIAIKPHKIVAKDDAVKIETGTVFNGVNRPLAVPTEAASDFDTQDLDNQTREYTETTHLTSHWILDTLQRENKQCIVISLSGGADSTLGATQVRHAVDLYVKEFAEDFMRTQQLDEESARKLAIESLLMTKLSHLKRKDEFLAAINNNSSSDLIKMIMNQILVAVYMPTANSSVETQESARSLIEGGTRQKRNAQGKFEIPLQNEEGAEPFEGIGGRFFIANLQQPMEDAIVSYSGKKENYAQLLTKNAAAVDAAFEQAVQGLSEMHKKNFVTTAQKVDRLIVLQSEGNIQVLPEVVKKLVAQDPPTWVGFVKGDANDMAKQNMQPRLRSIMPWFFGELYDGVPLYTSNLSEAIAGYSTWAGDTSLGYQNGLGGILKSDIRRQLIMFEKGQLCGLKAYPSLYYVNNLEPSAELRQLLNDGSYTQTDEADLMPYINLDAIYRTMIYNRMSPVETYLALRDRKVTIDGQEVRMFSDRQECLRQISKLCNLFVVAQFKRTGGGNAPFTGSNVDAHMSLETTLISKHLPNGRVDMQLFHLVETLNGHENFKKEYGISVKDLSVKAKQIPELRNLITWTDPTQVGAKLKTWLNTNLQNGKIQEVKMTVPVKATGALFTLSYNNNNNNNAHKHELDVAVQSEAKKVKTEAAVV